jgi:uncharacterized protein YjbJ (UPF0337 family)
MNSSDRRNEKRSNDLMQGKFKQLKDAIKQPWGTVTDKDLDTVEVKLDQLPSQLQSTCGCASEQAEK